MNSKQSLEYTWTTEEKSKRLTQEISNPVMIIHRVDGIVSLR